LLIAPNSEYSVGKSEQTYSISINV